jgi:phospholipid/cholesterol/gamma-HCH transport system substrate-binding protein
MKNTLETRLGIFVALVVIAALFILEMVGGLERFHSGYPLYALFDNVQDLKPGDRVKMAGVSVGRVEKIGFAENENKVKVQLKLRKNVQVKTDSVATIRFTGLMGQNFVALDFGSRGAPAAAPGTILASTEQPDLGTVMAKIDVVASGVTNLTKSFSGDSIANLVGPLMDFVKKNQEPLTAIIANVHGITREVSQGQGTVGKLIYDDALYNASIATITNLQDAAEEIKTTVADARKVVDQVNLVAQQVNAGQGTVGKLLKDEALYRETTASMTNLREILQKINQGQGSVGKIVNDPELYKNAKLTLQKLDKATEGLEDQGPLSVMGLLVNSLF